MASHENLYMSNIILTEEVLFRNIYVCTYIHVIIVNETVGHKFKREQSRRGLWLVCRDKSEGEIDIIIL